MVPLKPPLRVRWEHWEQMKSEVSRLAPEEACGLLVAEKGETVRVIPVENELHSPVRFRMSPQQQLDAFLLIEKMGWELAGIYHSHPLGPDHPSETDLSEAAYPESLALIWSAQTGEWVCQAFWIDSGQAEKSQLKIVRIE